MVNDLSVEASPNWPLKNSLSDCVYQNEENSLRRNMTEIKTFEEAYTGKMVSSVSEGGCVGARFSSYECRDQVKVWDLNIESRPKWILKKHMNDWNSSCNM